MATNRPGAADALQWLEARLCTAAALGEARWGPLFAPAGDTVVVGAGGSWAAADFLARCLRRVGVFARSARPLDIDGPFRQLVAVSYSGSAPDAVFAMSEARRQGVERVALLTGNATSGAGADLVLCHRRAGEATGKGPDGLERGFLSFAGTVAPCAAAVGSICSASQAVSAIRSARNRQLVTGPVEALRRARVVDVVATGFAWPAALDLESKWTEADLGPLRLHEAKDFSHGRYQSVLGEVVVLVSVGPPRPYDVSLRQILAASGPLIEISSTSAGPVGGLAVLTASQSLAVEVGMARGRDVSRPAVIAEAGVELYNWRWK